MRTNNKLRQLAAAIAGFIIAVGLAVAVDVGDDGSTHVEIRTGPIAKAPAGDLAAPAGPAVERAPDAELRDETPPDVNQQTLRDGLERTRQLGMPLEPGVVAGAQNYACRQDFGGHVWSGYSFKPTEGVFHYTVSANIAGWGDVNGIVDYFERTRIASADRVIDFEGHCTQMVPITTGKAWTQGAANGATCWAYEIIATGRETRSQWLASPLIRKGILASIARDDSARCGIPLRRVNPAGCTFPPGITDHNALECGNSHTDVAPAFPWDVVMRQIQDGPKPVTLHARKLCQELNRLRNVEHRNGWLARRAAAIKKALAKKYTCSYGPPGSIRRR